MANCQTNTCVWLSWYWRQSPVVTPVNTPVNVSDIFNDGTSQWSLVQLPGQASGLVDLVKQRIIASQ